MYESSGNYEAFARPRPVKDAERKKVWLVGNGLALIIWRDPPANSPMSFLKREH